MHATLRFGSMTTVPNFMYRTDKRYQVKKIFLALRLHRTITQKANINLDTEHRAQSTYT